MTMNNPVLPPIPRAPRRRHDFIELGGAKPENTLVRRQDR